MRAYDLKAEDRNTNSIAGPLSSSKALAMDDARQVGMYVKAKTGTHVSHIVTLQISGDNKNTWDDTVYTITGVGFLENIEVICTHIRLKTTTAEGAASTCDFFLVIK